MKEKLKRKKKKLKRKMKKIELITVQDFGTLVDALLFLARKVKRIEKRLDKELGLMREN